MASEETTPKINIATKVKEHFKKYWRGYAFGAVLTAAVAGVYFLDKLQKRIGHFERTAQTAEGYVIPAEIKKIEVADLDLDGKVDATIIQYENQTLLFKVSKTYDGKTKLEANPFEIMEKK